MIKEIGLSQKRLIVFSIEKGAKHHIS